jgi:hypothetical protein
VRRAYALLVLGVTAALPSASAAEEALIDLVGNSWERGMYAARAERPFPDAGRSTAPSPRSGGSDRTMKAVGELTRARDPLLWSPFAFSVSWSLRGLDLLRDRREGDTRVSEYTGGRITFHTDGPSELPQYGTHPPNATAPAEFEDGFSVYLDALLSDVRLTFDEESGLGTFQGNVRFVGGDALSLLPDPSGWALIASLERGSPPGYSFWITGGIFRDESATGVESRSWAISKARFR